MQSLRPCFRFTDSTHVLVAVRTLNRLESIGETLRATLNAMATVEPEWLKSWVPSDWFVRYGRPVEEYRLPKGKEARQTYAEAVGRMVWNCWDGFGQKSLCPTYSSCHLNKPQSFVRANGRSPLPRG